MITRALAALVFTGLLAVRAEACSCALRRGTPEEQVRQNFEMADRVFVARVVRSTLKPDRREPRLVFEDAQLQVIEVFKGDLRKGQLIRVYQSVSAGSCGLSSTNDPPWLMEIRQPGPDASETPRKISKEWLVYASGPEPYQLSLCSRSMPMNSEGDLDAKYLRKLVKKASGKH